VVNIFAAGAFGRVYLAGEEKDVVVAAEAALAAINDIDGRSEK